jgi:cytochrome c biogenesis protein CcdA
VELGVATREESKLMMKKIFGFILGFSLILLYCFILSTLAEAFNINNYDLLNLAFYLGIIFLLLILFLRYKFKPLFIGALSCAILTILLTLGVRGVYNDKYKSSESKANTATFAPK